LILDLVRCKLNALEVNKARLLTSLARRSSCTGGAVSCSQKHGWIRSGQLRFDDQADPRSAGDVKPAGSNQLPSACIELIRTPNFPFRIAAAAAAP